MWHRWSVVIPLALALLLFLGLAGYQLDLPGLHYDEAKEAGLNAMQLLTGQPVTAFRDATFALGSWRIPLMVQDYIGNLNVLLVTPFLAIGGINTVALRVLPVLLAALTVVFVWRIAYRLSGGLAAAAAALLLAVNPSFVFWSRQGIFVTNITALLLVAALWFVIQWLAQRRPRDLALAAFCAGLGVYAKLLFVWAVIALAIVAAAVLLVERRRGLRRGIGRPLDLVLVAAAFVVPLVPLIVFNLRTSGTLTAIFGNLGRSYYGVDNSAYGANLALRAGQVMDLLRGDHFWYLGEPYANALAPWALLVLLVAACVAMLDASRAASAPAGRPQERTFGSAAPMLPLALLALIVLQSAFTVSDLFITHFALATPLLPLFGGLALAGAWHWARRRAQPRALREHGLAWAGAGVALLAALAWFGGDAATVVRYHRILTVSGGYAGHSDAIYRLAGYLDREQYTSPVVLDWGIDAPVRFLTQGRVVPVDVFGYDRLDAPDGGFETRVAPYLEDWQTIYVAHAPEKAVFQGRVEAMAGWAAARGWRWLEQIRIAQRSGEAVFIVHRFLE